MGRQRKFFDKDKQPVPPKKLTFNIDRNYYETIVEPLEKQYGMTQSELLRFAVAELDRRRDEPSTEAMRNALDLWDQGRGVRYGDPRLFEGFYDLRQNPHLHR